MHPVSSYHGNDSLYWQTGTWLGYCWSLVGWRGWGHKGDVQGDGYW